MAATLPEGQGPRDQGCSSGSKAGKTSPLMEHLLCAQPPPSMWPTCGPCPGSAGALLWRRGQSPAPRLLAEPGPGQRKGFSTSQAWATARLCPVCPLLSGRAKPSLCDSGVGLGSLTKDPGERKGPFQELQPPTSPPREHLKSAHSRNTAGGYELWKIRRGAFQSRETGWRGATSPLFWPSPQTEA